MMIMVASLLAFFQLSQSFQLTAKSINLYNANYLSAATFSRLSLPVLRSNTGPDDDLEDLFSQIKDMEPEDVPVEMQDAIRDKIAENAPADWKIRLNLMGFNPLTIAGYALAAVLIACNTIFGAGWAGDMLGMNEVIVSDRTQVPQPRIGSNERFSNSYDGIVRTEVQTIELNKKENLL
jgi:hypothetical protein